MKLTYDVMEYYGIKENEEFNITGAQHNPYTFQNGMLFDVDGDERYDVLFHLVYGGFTIDKY